MRKHILFLLSLPFFLVPAMGDAQVPHEIAGFVLGKNISHYKDRIKPETDLPMRHMESIHEVEIKNLDGFKSGLLTYGTCHETGRILKIRLKYADSSKKFYETLFKRFKDRFGEPAEWQGDPFHIVISWKWSFMDKENNRISLQLQHNTKDVEEKIGNSVKLSMTNAMEAEQRCLNKKEAEVRTKGKKKKGRDQKKPIPWESYIPR
jgi:hypothetical protein